jgi:membrane protease YdiL (CAAX protease family)
MSNDENPHARLQRARLRPATTGEIALVLGIPIALSLASSIRIGLMDRATAVFTDRNLLLSLGLQVIIAGLLLLYLSRRQWRPLDVAGAPALEDLGRGLALWLGLIAIFYLAVLALYMIAPAAVAVLRTRAPSGVISAPVVVAGAVLDPIFEEFLWLGYAIPALGNRFGITTACVVSVVLRVAAHAYQGRLVFLTILPVAVIMTFYFVKTGRLWPVIVAHIIQDAIALSFLKGAV